MKKFFKALWMMMRSNLMLKIVAILFAIILWSYVLSNINPLREKEITNVSVTLNTENLQTKNLAVSTDLSDIPETVDIRVQVNRNDIRYLNNQNSQAYIDLSGIDSAGTYTRTIEAKTTYGQVIDVSPSTVTLHVDKYVTRQVPVIYDPVGNVPFGYYAFTPQINPGFIVIRGAETDVQKVVSARCTVDLNGLTKGYSKSFEVDLIDSAGDVVDPVPFTGTMSVIVDLNVLPVKEVEVDAEGSIVGQDSLAPGYEITDIKTDPDKVRIVGQKPLLDGVNSVTLLPFSVAGADNDVISLASFAPPEGITVIDVDKAQVTVTIREKTEQKTYKDVEIKVKNLSAGLTSAVDPSSVDVTVLAGKSLMSKLLRSDIVPYIDLDGLAEGVYSLKVYFELPDGFAAENFTPSALTVNVTIRRK